MKKNYVLTILMAIAIGMFSNVLTAQGFYGRLNLGYGFAKSKMNLEWWQYYNYSLGTNSSTSEQILLSLGKGFNAGLIFGDMFNENVGAELGLNYLVGGKCKATDEYPGGSTEYEFFARMFRIIPAIVVSAGNDGINPYAKFGVVISTGSLKLNTEGTDDGDSFMYKEKYNGGIALGFMGAAGASMPINDMISIFVEINTINQSYAPKKGELTEATYNGDDLLPNLTISQKEYEFVKEITYDGTTPPTSEPQEVLKQAVPMGSVGVNFGIEIHL